MPEIPAESHKRISQYPDEKFQADCEKYDVVVAGAGPAGLLLSSLLARYGIHKDSSLLCIEPRLGVTAAGHADGLHARSLEMFKLLDLYEEVMKVATEVGERARWAETPSSTISERKESNPPSRMERVLRQKVALAPNARMKQLISISQGQIERILQEDLDKRAEGTILRGYQVVDVEVDQQHATHPVKVTVKSVKNDDSPDQYRFIRCKYVVGADGAHSTVRKRIGASMEGDSTDHAWGVIDFVTDTDFPDIRRLTTVQNSSGMAMCIPREKNSQGEWLTRFYVDMNDLELRRQGAAQEVDDGIFIKNQQRRSRMKVDDILQRLREIFSPFRMAIKANTEVDWFTAYAIGQRVASEFLKEGPDGMPRIFLVGDACHTHSPKLGQGMNVSMADSFNLAWKLTHAVRNTAAQPDILLKSYATERSLIAKQLIELDRRWYNIQWADGERKNQPGYQDECVKLYQDLSGFTSGCGIHYVESVAVKNEDKIDSSDQVPVVRATPENDHGCTPNSGMIKPGRRLLNITMTRLADGCQWDIHDDFKPEDASLKILAFCGRDIFDQRSQSANVLEVLFDQVIPSYENHILNASVVTTELVSSPYEPLTLHSPIADFELWDHLPQCVKRVAEMKVYSLSKQGYDTYGIDQDLGAIVVIRPDGIVGTVMAANPEAMRARLEQFLGRIVSHGKKSPDANLDGGAMAERLVKLEMAEK